MASLRRGVAATLGSLALLLTSACLTVGRPFPTDAVGQLPIGQTTRDEVHRIFGEPWRAGVEDGRRTWTYGHFLFNDTATTETRDLVVRFDARGVGPTAAVTVSTTCSE